MGKIIRFQLETFFILILMILGFVIIFMSIGYGFGNLRRPGPGLYPFFIGVFLILPFSIVIFILALKPKRSEPLFDKYGLRKFLLMILTFILWIMAMPFLGYVVVTFITTYCFCKVMMLEGWLKPFALSISTALFIYLLFDVWLYIDLPRGILG